MSSSSSSNRLWVGPLLLILVIALIYIFSLVPNGSPHRELSPSAEEAYQTRFSPEEREFELQTRMEMVNERRMEISQEKLLGRTDCLNGGIYNETLESCVCDPLFTGSKCQTPMKNTCLNNGFYSQKLRRCHCHLPWSGDHCQHRCSGGHVNRTTGACECMNRFFGSGCDLVCVHGLIIEGVCRCNTGFVGVSCASCDPAYLAAGECDITLKRRGAVNSRLTLSGLSFCMITIGLLCVTARRRRNGMVPPSDDTWYRVFHSAPARPNACRHSLVCGGSWVPRDRALIVAPGRAALTHGSGRRSNSLRSGSRRAATPPPSYTSVDNLAEPDEQSPPTYEEATQHIEGVNTETIDETLVQEQKEDTPLAGETPVLTEQ